MIMNILEKAFNSTWPFLSIILITLICIRFFYLKNHRSSVSLIKEVINLLAITYILLLFALLTETEMNEASGFNIVPFSEISRYTFGSKLFVFNVLGNIFTFIPFGLFVSYYIKPKTFFSTFLTSLLTSSVAELVQLKIGRSFDVDDIILNVIGGLLGYLIYEFLKFIKKKFPRLSNKDRLFNLICIIIIVVLILYIMKRGKLIG